MDVKAKLRAASFALQAVFQIGQELRSGRLEPGAAAQRLEASNTGLRPDGLGDGGRAGGKAKKAKKAKKEKSKRDKKEKKSRKAKAKGRKEKKAKRKSTSSSSADSSSAGSQSSAPSVIDVDGGKRPKRPKKAKRTGKPAKTAMPAVPANLGVLTIADSDPASEEDCPAERAGAREPSPPPRPSAGEPGGPDPVAFDGSWVSATGERVEIAGRVVSAGDGTEVPMSRAGEGWFALDMPGEAAPLTARLAPGGGRLEWSDGDVWRLLPSSVAAGAGPPLAAPAAEAPPPEGEAAPGGGGQQAAEGAADGSERAAQAVMEARLRKEDAKRRKDQARREREAKRARRDARRAARAAGGAAEGGGEAARRASGAEGAGEEDAAGQDDESEEEDASAGGEGGPAAARRLAESCYAEDARELGHGEVWGSWYDAPTGRWGYACCRGLCRGLECTLAGAAAPAVPAGEAPGPEQQAEDAPAPPARGVGDLPPREAFADPMGFLAHWAEAALQDWRRGLRSGSAALLGSARFGKQEQLLETERAMAGLLAKIRAASCHYFRNEAVHVWSVGNCRWMKDGKVLDILEEETAVSGSKTPADGCVMPAGSLLVSFCDGSAKKWLAPDQLEGRVRKAQPKELDKADVEALDRVATLAVEREYQAANQAYVELTIGSGKWHGSFSLKGQTGCAKAPRNGQKVMQDRSNILDTEESKEFVMGMKRLLSFLQLVRPNEDVSKHANI